MTLAELSRNSTTLKRQSHRQPSTSCRYRPSKATLVHAGTMTDQTARRIRDVRVYGIHESEINISDRLIYIALMFIRTSDQEI